MKFHTAHAIYMEKIFRIYMQFSEYFENCISFRSTKFQLYMQIKSILNLSTLKFCKLKLIA